ncbi:hypothetical protein GCM10009814_00160 [Lapillicoccus jejuensis]
MASVATASTAADAVGAHPVRPLPLVDQAARRLRTAPPDVRKVPPAYRTPDRTASPSTDPSRRPSSPVRPPAVVTPASRLRAAPCTVVKDPPA